MHLIRTNIESIRVKNSFEKDLTEYWKLNNNVELTVFKHFGKNEHHISVRCLNKTITPEIYEELIKIEKYKRYLDLILVLGNTYWIVVPKDLSLSVMNYIENMNHLMEN